MRQYIEPSAAGRMCNELRKLTTLVGQLSVIERSRDPADNFLLGMARAGRADFLVTGDKHGSGSGESYEEIRNAGQQVFVYGLAIVFVFLFLAALYESWSLPFSVLLGTLSRWPAP